MVFAMAIIGAITRLTESGLSITEWKPIMGTLPPLTPEAWDREFALYQKSPEFIHKHHWMTLADFKNIYFWEWLHRLWGRVIGLVYALPLLWFAVRKQIPAGYGHRFLIILAFGGLQGMAGWWMVASGLVDRPAVSHFRLAVHLGLALVIFGALWWTILDLKHSVRKEDGFLAHTIIAFVLLVFTIIWGAFTAGLDAGLVYNTFPLMDGRLVPAGSPDILYDHGWVQFTHRYLAKLTGVVILALAWRTKNVVLAAMVLIQIGLGIATVLSGVPVVLGALHQAGGIILLGLMINTLYEATARLRQISSPYHA